MKSIFLSVLIELLISLGMGHPLQKQKASSNKLRLYGLELISMTAKRQMKFYFHVRLALGSLVRGMVAHCMAGLSLFELLIVVIAFQMLP